MGTLDNIFLMHSLISHCLNNNKNLYSAFIDFKKAFDFVVRDVSSRKHFRTKVAPDFHLTYSKNGGNLGSESK